MIGAISTGLSLLGGSSTLSSGETTENSAFSGLLNALPVNDALNGISDILSNGFMTSCYNSTYTPAKFKALINTTINPFLLQKISAIDTATNEVNLTNAINEAAKAVYINKNVWYSKLHGHNWAKCSKTALQNILEYSEQIVKAFEASLTVVKSTHNLTKVNTVDMKSDIMMNEERIYTNLGGGITKVPVYAIKTSLTGSITESLNISEDTKSNAGVFLTGASIFGTLLHYFKNN